MNETIKNLLSNNLFRYILLIPLFLLVTVYAAVKVFDISIFSEKQEVATHIGYNSSNREAVKKINEIAKKIDGTVSEENRKYLLEGYSVVWSMINSSSTDEKLTGSAYLYFLYTESNNMYDWFMEGYTLYAGPAKENKFLVKDSGLLRPDTVILDQMLSLQEIKNDYYLRSVSAYLLSRDLNRYVSEDMSTTTIPESYKNTLSLAVDLLNKNKTDKKTQFKGVRFYTNMNREEVRAKILLSMFGKWDISDTKESYDIAIENIAKRKAELVQSGDVRKELYYAYKNEVFLRLNYASYLWVMNQNDATKEEIKNVLAPTLTDEYKKYGKSAYYGIATVQNNNSFTKLSFKDISEFYPEFKNLLQISGWKF